MKHYGDITKINGSEVPIVDIVCGGSPCQDLSVAGKRAGLAGERSGLFMEQIRIIKEMRNESIKQLRSRGADDDLRLVRPRYMVWENVPGAFSSNGGEDFRAVLEETARIADENAVIPRPSEKWTNAGCIMGDGWSIAWRLHDAQFWGVPQRRRRIALVADFGGETAPEILFERESVSRDLEPGRTEREGITNDTTRRSYQTEPVLLESNQNHATVQTDGVSTALPASMGMGGGYVPMVARSLTARNDGSYCADMGPDVITQAYDAYQHSGYRESETAGHLTAEQNNHVRGDTPIVAGKCWDGTETCSTLTANNAGGSQRMPDKENFNAVICYGLDRASFNQGKNAQYDFSVEKEKAQTIVSRGPGGVSISNASRKKG